MKETRIKGTGEGISDELWATGLDMIKACSVSAKLWLIQVKVAHQLHFWKTKLNRIVPSFSATCDECESGEGTAPGHLYWSCPKLKSFWDDILHLSSDIYSIELIPDCQTVSAPQSTFHCTDSCEFALLLRSMFCFVWLYNVCLFVQLLCCKEGRIS